MARIYLTRWHHRKDMHNGDSCYSSEYSSCCSVHNNVYAVTEEERASQHLIISAVASKLVQATVIKAGSCKHVRS